MQLFKSINLIIIIIFYHMDRFEEIQTVELGIKLKVKGSLWRPHLYRCHLSST